MSIPALTPLGLPIGRWPSSLTEIEAQFVAGQHAVRQVIWDDFAQLLEAVRDVVGQVAAVWISGSFLTGKSEPKDIDCLFVIDWAKVVAAKLASEDVQFFLNAVANSKMKELFGLKVDSYILEWMPTPGPERGAAAGPYLENRGYWDDLWGRVRSVDEREDAITRRGYLEVILDGYV